MYDDAWQKIAGARDRCRWILKIRPQSLATAILKLFSPYERRHIAQVEGLTLYVDPLSHLAGSVLCKSTFEPSTVALFKKYIHPGGVILDIGANEGFFSALSAKLAGPKGLVIAIEPQSRLQDILKINLALNASCRTVIYHSAVSDKPDVKMSLSLTPPSNTGASSLVESYRWSRQREIVPTITAEQIILEQKIQNIDFIKVDVEGFEPNVVKSLLPLLKLQMIDVLLIDYHASILRKRNIDAKKIEQTIVASGYEIVNRESETESPAGYVVYKRQTTT